MGAAGLPANGEVDGYKASSYAVTPSGWKMAMNPVPGVTGGETAYATGLPGGSVAIDWKPAPGAAAGRAAMFAEVRAAGAVAVEELLSMPKTGAERKRLTEQVARETNDPMAVREAFDAFKGTDGRVSLSSIRKAGPGTLILHPSIQAGMLEKVLVAMRVGAYGERWESIPGIGLSEVDAGSLVSVQRSTLRSLTATFAGTASARQALLEILSDTDRDMLKRYQAKVRELGALPAPAISPLGVETLGGAAAVLSEFPWQVAIQQ